MPPPRPGNALPFLLLAAFRTLIDELHRRLAEQGHPELQPAHGFAMQMISRGGSLTDLGRRLGVTKQAAHKTVKGLEALGYARRKPSPVDGRRIDILLTDRGADALALSGEILNQLRDEWALVVGEEEMGRMENTLEKVGKQDGMYRILGWLGS
ncbi:MarR family winged helix-turn-helix transcriptional regulator [Streptomyces sp. NPDC005438]|uniref:MarR family winged helix-turn-helix transcriptional regulator n=1 Tax=Streptomyces sp. NPDC005438 TaxID=3156880 RepID=UPI0033A5C0B3